MKKVGLIIGHCEKAGGAVMYGGKYNEYGFWKKHIHLVADELVKYDIDPVILCREMAGGTSPSYAAKVANGANVDLAVEFHFNSASSPSASGTEVLYWYGSGNGLRAAKKLQRAMCGVLKLGDRGVVGVTRNGRGAEYLRQTVMPAVIIEPCFAGSNPQDEAELIAKVKPLCKAIAQAIVDWCDD